MKKIHVTCVTPVYVRGEFKDDIEIDTPELEALSNELQNLLKNVVEAVKRVKDSDSSKNLELFNDLVVAALKRSLILPLAPTLQNSKRIAPWIGDLFYLWLFEKYYKRTGVSEVLTNKPLISIKWDEDFKEYWEKLVSYLQLEKIFFPQKERALDLLKLPADSRPGLSSARLIPHLLAVSAIATSKYIAQKQGRLNGKDFLNLQILRAAAILHDLGKPRAWCETLKSQKYVSHATYGAMFIDSLNLEDLLGQQISQAIKELVENHHLPDKLPDNLRELGKILQEADHKASEIDRLSDLLSKDTKLTSVINIDLNSLYKTTGVETWNKWLSLDDSALTTLSKTAAEVLRKPNVQLADDKLSYIEDVSLLGIDIMSIQKFIAKEEIRGMIAGSALIDAVTFYAIPKTIMETFGFVGSDTINLPPEAIVYAGGGSVFAIVPELANMNTLLQRIEQKIERELGGIKLKLAKAVTKLATNWGESMRRLSVKLNAFKLLTFNEESQTKQDTIKIVPLIGYEKLCELCRRRHVNTTYGNDFLCDECKAVVNFGDNMYIYYRLSVLRDAGYKTPQDVEKLKQRLLEWLSGAQDWKNEAWDIAVIKADGNMMGTYMAQAFSISEAFTRSILIDYALKMGIYRAFNNIHESFLQSRKNLSSKQSAKEEADEALQRLYFGILYAGGDDLLAIIPSYLSLHFAISLATAFWEILGGQKQLSIAIAAGKPKQNIWNIIETSNHLEDLCKKEFRKSLFKKKGSLAGLISVFHSENQLLEALVDHSFETHVKYTNQPFIIEIEKDRLPKRELNDLSLLLSVFTENSISTKAELERFPVESNAKNVLDVLHEIYTAQKSFSMVGDDALVIYIARQSESGGSQEKSDIYGKFGELVKKTIEQWSKPLSTNEQRKLLPIFDEYLIAKILEGGR
jgi:HD superfamily phosphodiesterase